MTKKVKSRGQPEEGAKGVLEVVCEREAGLGAQGEPMVTLVNHSLNFKEALLNVEDVASEDDFGEDEGRILPEDKWYVDQEDPKEYADTEGLIPVIQVSDEELLDWCDAWKLTLVVNVLGKKLNYRVLESKIRRDGDRNGGVKIIDLPKGYYAVQFTSEDDYKHVLFEGPWKVADHYLIIQRWRPNFVKSAAKVSRVAVWIRIPELALELYNKKFLSRLGNTLGSFLKMDNLTNIRSRGQFARICVELDLTKPLISQVVVRGEMLNLEYEGLHSICFHCGVYGHRMDVCPRVGAQAGSPGSIGKKGGDQAGGE